MGWWTVLYIAFGVVALWLLGEVLLQYKARLRWRLVAFFGFLGVPVGVLLSSVPLIVAGAVAFLFGQALVTLSFMRGFSTGWALGGRPGSSRRRRTAAKDAGPTLEVSGLEYDDEAVPAVQDAASDAATDPYPMPGTQDADPATAADPATMAYTDPYPAPEYADTTAYGYGYGYGADEQQQQYAAYSDPYIGGGYADPYAPQYGSDTPPGGVWVPPQRDPQQEQQPAYGYDQNGRPYPY